MNTPKPMKHNTGLWIKTRVLHGINRGQTPEQIAYNIGITVEKVNETIRKIKTEEVAKEWKSN